MLSRGLAAAVTRWAPTLAGAGQGCRAGHGCTSRRVAGVAAATAAATASEALECVAAAAVRGPPHAAGARSHCRNLLAAHASLDPESRVQWWLQHAVADEEAQLEHLCRALPRGGRVAPQLLDAVAPVTPAPVITAFKQLVGMLGSDGLRGALQMRAAVRMVTAIVGPSSPQGFALQRLDRQMQDVLALWFSPGFLEADLVEPDAMSEVRKLATMAGGEVADSFPNHRCFVLLHPQLRTEEGTPMPILAAHASVLHAEPTSLAEALAPLPDSAAPKAACVWALGATIGPLAEGLRGLGLGQILRQRVCESLRAELAPNNMEQFPITALVPLQGFAAQIREWRSWDDPDLEPSLAESLRRAALGESGIPGDKVHFTDADGDPVQFRLSTHGGHHLELVIGDSAPRRISRLRADIAGHALRFIMEPGAEALQVDVPQEAVERGDLAAVAALADASGMLQPELREHALRLASAYVMRRAGISRRAADPRMHFHFLGGATLQALHWRASHEITSLQDSFGIMASFSYEGPAQETTRAATYMAQGAPWSDRIDV